MKTISIIGGGCSGASVAIQQIWALSGGFGDEFTSLPNKIKIKIFEPRAKIGAGMPYSDESDIARNAFLLNQPAYAMSPFFSNKTHFVDWLQKRDATLAEDCFVPRTLFGDYMNETFKKAVSELDPACGEVEVVHSVVSSVSRRNGAYIVSDQSGTIHLSDSIVVANGHPTSDYLSELRKKENFYDMPFDAEKCAASIKALQGNLLLIGTSQSMLDALAIIDQTNFAGRVFVVSRNGVLPWSFRPAAYKDTKPDYQFKIINPELFGKDLSFDEMKAALSKEEAVANAQGYEMGHIVSAFKAERIRQNLAGMQALKNLDRFEELVRKVYGNPTPPQRYDMLQKYIQSSRLTVLRGDFNAGCIEDAKGGRYAVALKDYNGSGIQSLEVAAIFNCAGTNMMVRRGEIVSNPILNQLHQRRALYFNNEDQNAFLAGRQQWDNLYLVGPATNSKRWGVGTFGKSYEDVALQSLRDLNDKPDIQQEKMRGFGL